MPEATRQLAAVMFTNIVGYTALMGESEIKALEVRRRNWEIHQQKIKKSSTRNQLLGFGAASIAQYET